MCENLNADGLNGSSALIDLPEYGGIWRVSYAVWITSPDTLGASNSYHFVSNVESPAGDVVPYSDLLGLFSGALGSMTGQVVVARAFPGTATFQVVSDTAPGDETYSVRVASEFISWF
jgi:hypothetical protein